MARRTIERTLRWLLWGAGIFAFVWVLRRADLRGAFLVFAAAGPALVLRQRGRVVIGWVLRCGAWLVETAETYLIARLVGIELDLTHALAMEAVVVFVRNIAFVVPAGLGYLVLWILERRPRAAITAIASIGGETVFLVPGRLVMTHLRFHPPPRVLLICGNRNHTTTMHAIARELADCELWFTPYYCDPGSPLDVLRRAGLLELVALGHGLRRRCLRYLRFNQLAIDVGGRRGGYDLVVTCSDLIVPSNVAGVPLIGVQEGLIDPKLFWWRVRERLPWLPVPRWAAGTACTGLSHAYEAYCVASEGYRRDFIARGAPAGKLVVTGLPNFDHFAGHVRPGHWIEGAVLACTSDGRETVRRDDRRRFIAWALELAGDRPLVFKFHPNERMRRAVGEVHRWAPRARVATCGSGEELAANCHTLITEWSTLAYVGLALGKPTYSYRDLGVHRALLPAQHGRGARNIAEVCRDVIARHRSAALRGAA